MIGLDSTFLIDLYWIDSPRHKNAVQLFSKLSKEASKLLIFYNCFNEFIHVITDSKRFENAFSMKQALEIVETWCCMEEIQVIYPDDSSFTRERTWLNLYNLGRNRLNDTSMAACYAQYGVSKIITANPSDFKNFEIFESIDYSDYSKN